MGTEFLAYDINAHLIHQGKCSTSNTIKTCKQGEIHFDMKINLSMLNVATY